MFQILLIIAIIIYVVGNINKKTSKTNYKEYQPQYEWSQQQSKENNNEKNYIDGYQKTPLLSKHEADAYKRIKEAAEEKDYTVFTKVRILDLVEPKTKYRKEQAYLWKIQAKHVDFVVCDEKMVAKWIIELQDSSHEREDRIERDNLVKAILSNCNYKILMTYTADKEEIRRFLDRPPKNIVN